MSSSPSLSSSVNVDKLLSDVKECVEDLGNEFNNSGVPIDDDNQNCQRLCAKLEQFLSLGFIEKVSLFGRKKSSYWDFLKASLISTKGGVDSAIKFAHYNPEVRTSIGRGRAFLRYCLAHGCLGDALQQSLMAPETLSSWYSATAPMRDETTAQELVSAIYAVAETNFDLAPGGHDLDSGWPTFRRQFNSPSRALSWKPLSRSTSFTSLSSSFSLDPSSPPPVGSMGAMGSLPEDSQQADSNPAHTTETGQHERQLSPGEEIRHLVLEHRQEVTGLIKKYETEIKSLSDNNIQLQQEISQLRLDGEGCTSEKENSDSQVEDLKAQIVELTNLNGKMVFYEGECQRLQVQLQEKEKISRAAIKTHNESLASQDTEMHELKMKLLETQSENNNLKTGLSSMEVECSKMMMQLGEFENLKSTLESSEAWCQKYKEQVLEEEELRKKLAEVTEDYQRVVEKLKTEETRWGAEMEQRVQQAKWEMGSLQKCVDNLLKENDQLRNDLTKASTTMTTSRDKFTTNEIYVQKLTEQVSALKDVVSIGKQMLGMRDTEVAQLQIKVQNLEDMLETEREKNTVLSDAFKPDSLGDTDLKREYESQLENIRSLKKIYAQRIEIMSLENEALKEAGEDRNRQIELMDKRYKTLDGQYERTKETIAEKEKQATELQQKIVTANEECRALTNQLTMISNLFVELGKSDVDMEKLKALQEAMINTDSDTSSKLSKVWGAMSEIIENNPEGPQTPVSGSEGCYKSIKTPDGPKLVISVSQTFLRLKDLILEKKSLEKELGQLRNLNGHLETKLHQQERRLSLVLQELKKTWGVVNKMRTQHSQLRTSEAILRYDLQQKRKIVNELKDELQLCNDIWKQARSKTKESEDTYRELKDEFASRRRNRPLVADDSMEMNSGESGYSDDRGDDSGSTSEGEDNTTVLTPEETSRPASSTFTESDDTCSVRSFRKPSQEVQDNLRNEQAEEAPSTDFEGMLDARDARLKRMEEQASQLFRKVVRTSNMSVAISNRLEELHEQYGPDTDEGREAKMGVRRERGRVEERKVEDQAAEDEYEARRLLRKERRESRAEERKTEEILQAQVQDEEYEARRLMRKERREAARAAEEGRDELSAPTPAPARKTNLRLKISPPKCEGQITKAVKETEVLAEKVSEEKAAKEDREAALAKMTQDFNCQSESIGQLRKELKNMEKTLEDEVQGREELRETLSTTSKECVDLIQQVQELSKVESNLKTQLAAKEHLIGAHGEEMKQLQTDIQNLQEHVMNLVRQKEKLFKECYDLKHANRERLWQHDSQVQQCSSCRVQFSLLVRKHHCRHCGQIFCGACSSHWMPVSKTSSRRTRSCSECHTKLQDTDVSTSGEAGASSTDNSEEPISYEVRPDSDDEEDFSVISEDDVNLSQCVPYSPNPEILQYWKSCEVQSGMTKRVAEMLGHSVSEEVWVRAGVIYGVPLLVTAEDLAPQVNVTWQFSTDPNCIAFSILYKPDADVPSENSSILVPTTRVNSHLHPIKGRLKARREGVYTLMFDNSYSRFTGKKLNFSLSCEVGPGSGRSSADPESPVRALSKSPSKEFKPVEESM